MYIKKYLKYKNKYLDFKMKGGNINPIISKFSKTNQISDDLFKKLITINITEEDKDKLIKDIHEDKFSIHFAISTKEHCKYISQLVTNIKQYNIEILKSKQDNIKQSLHIYHDMKDIPVHTELFTLLNDNKDPYKLFKYRDGRRTSDNSYVNHYIWLDIIHDKVPAASTSKGGANVILVSADGFILCILEKRKGRFEGIHKAISGAVDQAENYISTAIREIREEVGIKLDLEKIKPVLIGGYTEKGNPYNDCFLTFCIMSDKTSEDLNTIIDKHLTNPDNKDKEVIGYLWLNIQEIIKNFPKSEKNSKPAILKTNNYFKNQKILVESSKILDSAQEVKIDYEIIKYCKLINMSDKSIKGINASPKIEKDGTINKWNFEAEI